MRVELATFGTPATNTTVFVTPPNPAGVEILKVFDCAIVEAIVPVAIPDELVVEPGWVRVFPVPVEANTVVAPLTGLLYASRRVIVTVDVTTPSAVTPEDGVAEIEEFPAAGAPAMKETVPPDLVTGVVICRVFVSA